MNTYRITYKDRNGVEQTIQVVAASEADARRNFAAQIPDTDIESVDVGSFTETSAGGISGGGASDASTTFGLSREQIEAERPFGGIFQRGFLEGIGVDPDAPLQGAQSRFFRTFGPTAQNVIRFSELLNPQSGLYSDFTDEGTLNQVRLSDLARNLGASATAGPQGILSRARATFSDLQDLATQGAPTSPRMMETLRPFLFASDADPDGTRRMQDLYNLGAGAALDRFGRFFGRDLIPNVGTVTGRFASASPEQRQSGFFDFLQNQLGLS